MLNSLNRRHSLRPWLLLVFAAFGLSAQAQPTKGDIDALMETTRERFQVPGLTLSIVHNGTVVHSAGYGLQEVGKTTAVGDQTLFQIASVSKAFTAAALAVLVDEGRLEWDAPVIDYLPEFRMHDPWVTREFTVRDLLTHRSGLPLGAGDLLMFPDGQTTRDEIILALRHLKPSSSFRSRYDYDNLLYIVAGEVVARVSGQSFEEFLEQRLLNPLAMQDCRASIERVPKRAAQATPHLLIDGELQITRSGGSALVAAAGGINCSARGMAHWMQFMLADGTTPDGEVLLSSKQHRELTRPVTLVSNPGYMTEHAGAHLGAYALGWNIASFYGEPMWSHGGGLWGMTTFIALLPERNLGIFVSNNQMSPAPRAAVNALLDAYLSDRPESGKDWLEIIASLQQQRQEAGDAAVAEAAAERTVDSQPSLALADYVGTYRDPWYGPIEISLEDGQLWFRSPRNPPLQGPLEHFQFDTFIARWTDRQLMADAYVSFTLAPEGGVERIRMKAVSPLTDFSFDFHDLDLRRKD